MSTPEEHTPTTAKKPWGFGRIMSIALSAIVLLFVVQNLAVVEVNLLFWSIQMPRAFLLAVIFLVGLVVGILLDLTQKRR